MNLINKYCLGDNILFWDKNQCEIRGVIEGKRDYENYIELKIRREDKSLYFAKVIKRKNEEIMEIDIYRQNTTEQLKALWDTIDQPINYDFIRQILNERGECNYCAV